MKKTKKKWEPRIVNIMADGSQVDDLTGYVIPAGHSYYDIILGMHKRELQEGA
ncbi:TPA: hypothetical protein VCY54_001483 [Streptococcus pyogenes]|uniref:BOW99_gp33 family protein n=1 Tax=Streptococcus pyogenes TaxID=1314 RepID=UPI002B1C7616|nr:hypothetical protein [Streptococcus pyogenes]HEP5142737.1 hypothetical protein [Streptococcus pyogenes]